VTTARNAAASRDTGAHRTLSPTAHPADASSSAPAGSSDVNADVGASEQGVARLDRRVIAVAAVVVALQMAVAGRYGWHRDELYFLACSRHLAWGYVDQPPFTPFVARVASAMFGPSLYGLRLFPALADASLVVLTGLLARELGGRRRAQLLAAVAVGSASVLLAVGHLLSTAVFDFLAWTALTTVVVHILRTDDARWWTVAGVIAGIGLENKHSVAFLLAGLAVAMFLTRRDLLRSRWLWVGAAIALVLWLPNLLWQADHGWPVFEMSRSLHTNGVDDGNTFLFLPMQMVFLGPFVTPLWIAGLVWLLRGPTGRDYQPLGIVWVLLALGFIGTAGKPYYLAGLYPALIAAGAVWFERRWSPRANRRYLAIIAIAGVVALPLALPVVSADVSGSGAIAAVNPELRETAGWEDFARTVDAVPGAIVFTQNYGEAGALERLGSTRPVYSGHNNYWLWGPPLDSTRSIVVVGHFPNGYVAAHFTGCQQRATIDNAEHIPNKERGAHVWTCTGTAHPWHREWVALRHYNG
jgi:hypothetical protein